MVRNVRNEIFIALFVVVLLAFAIVFGVFVSNNIPENPNETVPASEVFVGDSNIDTVETITPSQPSPSATTTPTAERNNPVTATTTFEPQETELFVPSNTPGIQAEEASLTPTDRITVTDSAMSAQNDVDDVTATAQDLDIVQTTIEIVSATTTNTRTPTQTATLTSTSTSTMTSTLTPTATVTASATATTTPTLTQTASNTPRPSEISPILPTLEPLATEVGLVPTLTAVNNRTTINTSGCSQPVGWTVYVVQPGNTLFSIAQAVNQTVAELVEVNCLENGDQIIAGDVLFVPRPPLGLQTTSQSNNMSVSNAGLMVIGCQHPGVQITSPQAGQGVSGTFVINGNASYGDQFGYYSLQIRSDSAANYNFYSRSDESVMAGVLGQIDSTLFNAGQYWLRLQIVDIVGNTPQETTCVIPIMID